VCRFRRRGQRNVERGAIVRQRPSRFRPPIQSVRVVAVDPAGRELAAGLALLALLALLAERGVRRE